MSFANKVVLLTGASTGIGAACAVQFAKLSANISLIGRNEENLRKVAEQCERERGIKPLIIKADLEKDDDVKKSVDETIRNYGTIDILINNAGISQLKGIQDGIESYDKIMATNVRAPFLITHYAVPHLLQSKGNIVNISSIAAQKPVGKFITYCMSKIALDMFTKCLAQDLGPKGVRVNAVSPGMVKTNIFANAGFDEASTEKLLASQAKLNPLKKIATTADIAEMVVFLTSDKAQSITGSIVNVDNGFTVL